MVSFGWRKRPGVGLEPWSDPLFRTAEPIAVTGIYGTEQRGGAPRGAVPVRVLRTTPPSEAGRTAVIPGRGDGSFCGASFRH